MSVPAVALLGGLVLLWALLPLLQGEGSHGWSKTHTGEYPPAQSWLWRSQGCSAQAGGPRSGQLLGFVWLWLAQARHQSPLLGRQVHHRLLESEGRDEDVDQDDDEIYSVAGEQKPYANCLR